MRTFIVLLLAGLVAITAIGQWKEKPKPTAAYVQSERPTASGVLVDSTVYTTSFAASFGYVSSAQIFQNSRFYGGALNIMQVIDEYSYLNLWMTIPGVNQLGQTIGLSYNRQLAVPFENLTVDWSAGIISVTPQDTLAQTWIGTPFGVRANYHFVGAFSLYAVVDAVPAYDINKNSPSGVGKIGLTVLVSAGISVTP